MSEPARIRPLDRSRPQELELVAQRMRQTLLEVLGEQRGRALYSLDWLRERVRFHLDPAQSTGEVFLAELPDGVAGHTIVRLETEEGQPLGLFSTIYVEPSARGRGIATALLREGERWLRARGQTRAATNTATGNQPLIALFEREGYRVLFEAGEMLRLGKELV